MKTAFITLASTLALSFSANAALLKLEPGSKTNNGVTISKAGQASIDGKDYDLTTVGSGLRSSIFVQTFEGVSDYGVVKKRGAYLQEMVISFRSHKVPR